MAGTACRCGCGGEARRSYLPGHDARHVGQLVRAYVDGSTVERRKIRKEASGLSEALQAKFERGLAKAQQ